MDNLKKNVVEKSGKTVEEAVELAIIALDIEKDDIDFEIIEEPSKGFLGIGGREAVIRAWKKKDVVEIADEFLNSVLDKIGIKAEIDFKLDNNQLFIDVYGSDMALLIGRRGQTLDSLQYLVSLVVNKGSNEYIRVVLDTENYREKRKQTLEKLAIRLAKKTLKIRKEIVLEPMNPYERRIIHSTLQNFSGIKTRSEGDEPFRKVVIQLA